MLLFVSICVLHPGVFYDVQNLLASPAIRRHIPRKHIAPGLDAWVVSPLKELRSARFELGLETVNKLDTELIICTHKDSSSALLCAFQKLPPPSQHQQQPWFRISCVEPRAPSLW